MTSIRWATPAVDDLRDVAQYIATDSQTAALAFLDCVDEAVQRLAQHPNSGRIVPELQRHSITGYRESVLSPWRLFYRYDQDTVIILAVIDGRRNVEDVLLRRFTRSGPTAGEAGTTDR